MKIAIFGWTYNQDFTRYIIEFFEVLHTRKIEVSIYKPFYDFIISESKFTPSISSFFQASDEAPSEVDFLISIGGDGTFLESIIYLKDFNIPVIGLNSGRLGYLANISKEEISEAIDAIIAGNFELENRSIIAVESDTNIFGRFNFALNEATIQKKDSSMITIDAYLDNEFLNTYWTDGLIVSTPTGSTAYNLSVGGPIVLPGSANFVILPIASHNLTVRPIVIPDNKKIRLEVRSRSGNFLVTADNRSVVLDKENNTFYLSRANFNLKMVKLPFNSYYSTLRNKLMWGADIRN